LKLSKEQLKNFEKWAKEAEVRHNKREAQKIIEDYREFLTREKLRESEKKE